MKQRLLITCFTLFFLLFKIAELSAVCNQAWMGDANSQIAIIDTNTQMQIASINLPVEGQVDWIAFTPDGLQVYVADSFNALYVINASTHVFSAIDSRTGYRDVVVSPDGKFAYAPNGPSNIILKINTQSNTFSVFSGPNNFSPQALTISPDGTRLYVIGFDTMSGNGEILVVNSSNGSILQTGMLPGFATDFSQIAITPNGQFVYVTNHSTNSVYQVSTTTLIVNPVSTGAFPAFASPTGVAIDPNGQFAYVTNTDFADSSIDVIQISTNTVVNRVLPAAAGPWGIAFTPDGKSAYVANFFSTMATVINTSNFSSTIIPTTDVDLISVGMAPLCVSGLKGAIGKNRDFWQTDLFSTICWSPPASISPTFYIIFRNGQQIATVSGDSTSFTDHYLKRDKTYVYTVFAVNAAGSQYFIGTITLTTD